MTTPFLIDGTRDAAMTALLAHGDRREAWDDLRSLVAGLHDGRTGFERRMTRHGGSIVDCVTAWLPDGATLLTFIDVSASVSVERALAERNQAMLEAEKLHNDFLQLEICSEWPVSAVRKLRIREAHHEYLLP